MKRNSNIRAAVQAVALVLALKLQSSTAPAQGLLIPPGRPSPTMVTLAQIEPRTPIASVPYTIEVTGSYYLTANLNCTVSNAITIAANGVSLDLSGFTISSSVANAANGGAAILLSSGLQDITIVNGIIRGGVTDNGGGVYSGSGFGNGIYFSGNAPVNVLVSRVSVYGCLDNGIYLYEGDSTVVESCVARTMGGYGIYASTIKQSSAIDCGGDAILGDQVSDCRGQTTSAGDGIMATTVLNSYGYCTDSGCGIYAYNAENCYGYSAGYSGGCGIEASTTMNCYGICGNGDGVAATVAQNCDGINLSGNGSGIHADNALNCNGTSDAGYGVYGTTAENCQGYSAGYGVFVSTAQNCFGSTYGPDPGIYAATVLNSYGDANYANGISASYIAIGCYGYSGNSIGVSALIANVCHGAAGTGGTPLSTSYNIYSY